MDNKIYRKALEFLTVIKNSNGDIVPSQSTFQRKFRISHLASYRIVKRLESEGYISEFNGIEPREVLKTI